MVEFHARLRAFNEANRELHEVLAVTADARRSVMHEAFSRARDAYLRAQQVLDRAGRAGERGDDDGSEMADVHAQARAFHELSRTAHDLVSLSAAASASPRSPPVSLLDLVAGASTAPKSGSTTLAAYRAESSRTASSSLRHCTWKLHQVRGLALPDRPTPREARAAATRRRLRRRGSRDCSCRPCRRRRPYADFVKDGGRRRGRTVV
jgi:hypothetical protein